MPSCLLYLFTDIWNDGCLVRSLCFKFFIICIVGNVFRIELSFFRLLLNVFQPWKTLLGPNKPEKVMFVSKLFFFGSKLTNHERGPYHGGTNSLVSKSTLSPRWRLAVRCRSVVNNIYMTIWQSWDKRLTKPFIHITHDEQYLSWHCFSLYHLSKMYLFIG